MSRRLGWTCILAAAALSASAALAAEGIRLPEPDFPDLSVAFWPSDEVDVDELKPLGLNAIKVFAGVPRSLKGVDVFALLDGWDAALDDEGGPGGAGGLAAVLKRFVEAGGMLVVFPPDEPDKAPSILPVDVKWSDIEQDDAMGQDGFPMEFLEPDHPVVREIGPVEFPDYRMTVSKPARVIVRHAADKTAMIAVADVGKGHVVLFGIMAMSLDDLRVLRSIGLWAAGKTKPPPADADRAALAAAHLARGFGGMVIEEIGLFDVDMEGGWIVELAKVRPATAALTSLVLDDKRPAWKPGGDHAGWKAVEALISALGSKDPEARSGARWALFSLAPIAYEPLQAAEKSKDPLVRSGAEEIIHLYKRVLSSGWDEPENVGEELLESIQSSVTTAREDLGITESVEKLVAWLRSGDTHRARLAAEELGRTGDRAAVAPLSKALSTAKDQSLKRTIVAGLVKLGGPQAIEAIGKAVKAETQASGVVLLCSALRGLPGPAADTVFAEAASRKGWSDPDLVQIVRLAGYSRKNTAWRRSLIKRALESRSQNLRLTAIRYVRRWDGPEVLVRLLDDADMSVRAAAAGQLASHFRNTHAGECHRAFVKLLGEKDLPQQAAQAARSIAMLYSSKANAGLVPEAAAALLPWLKRPNPPAQIISTAVYVKHGSLLAPLVKLLDHGERGVRAAAMMALLNWASRAGLRNAGGDEAEIIRTLKQWIEANPGFLGPPPGQDEPGRPGAPPVGGGNDVF